jgi:ABC-type antimicrobial peptide transport system permease subunit
MLYSFKILASQPTRLTLTVSGISLCMILILFLLGIYKGVADGSVEYIRENKADLWVLQKNSTNILRGTSILMSYQEDIIKKNENIEKVSPVLFLLTNINSGKGNSTIFLTGYNPELNLGGPPKIISGRSIKSSDEIILDYSFALKNNFKIGDKILILNDSLTVVGISSGTNAFVIQYAFTTIEQTRKIIGFPNLVTCFLVTVKNKEHLNETVEELQKSLKGIAVYNHQQFLQNNIREMESGILPILFTVAALGGIVLITVLSLILSINILEKKKDFAVMKILGAPNGFLPGLVIQQAVIRCFISGVTAIIFFFPIAGVIENISPEVSTKTNLIQIIIVFATGLVMGLISSLISIQCLRRIYPLEVFYEK